MLHDRTLGLLPLFLLCNRGAFVSWQGGMVVDSDDDRAVFLFRHVSVAHSVFPHDDVSWFEDRRLDVTSIMTLDRLERHGRVRGRRSAFGKGLPNEQRS